MGAAGDVQPEPAAGGMLVAAIERDVGCVALAPGGEVFEQPDIGRGIGGPHLECRHHGPGIGQHHAGREPCFPARAHSASSRSAP